ncbi:unnamed protein product [Staurois parvus]|uniref:Uncharacterized protein n=1 Tax=Staurois parvus TaxID=386267 RepID=A0ABN9D1T6_9NEOB|nr:unnamed protein product [Staurois parvus]
MCAGSMQGTLSAHMFFLIARKFAAAQLQGPDAGMLHICVRTASRG